MKTVLNGPTMWPADGNHLVGPAPEWDTAPNFWLACAEQGSQVLTKGSDVFQSQFCSEVLAKLAD